MDFSDVDYCLFGVLMAWLLFSKVDVIDMKRPVLQLGWISPLLASANGCLERDCCRLFASITTELFFKPTEKPIAEATTEGVGLTITGRNVVE